MNPLVGFLGLGHMGLPMARRIREAGFELVAWNRNPAKAEALASEGARTATTPREVAQACDLLFTCLTDDAAMEQVLFGEGGAGLERRRASVLVDTSTMEVSRALTLSNRLRDATGMAWVDAPVSGGPAGARAGTLATMAGGAEADVERMRPVAMAYSARLTHMGPVGTGQGAKVCNQMMFFGGVLAIAEALAVGQSMGLDTNRLPEALEGGFGDSNVLREYARAKAAGERGAIPALLEGLAALHGGAPPERFRGKLGIAVKDIGIVRAVSEGAGVHTPAMALAEQLLRALHD